MGIRKILRFLGMDPKVGIDNVLSLPRYLKDHRKLTQQQGDDQSFKILRSRPILNEWKEEAGVMKGHYFHQDFYIAQQIFNANPNRHIDIGSRIDGFVAHVATFRKIEIIDIRPQRSVIDNIIFRKADLTELPEDLRSSADSVSSLHAIEHFGLGRYGDPIDFYGHKKAIVNVSQILKPGGIFYFSVPIGPQRIEFNAHRVFSIEYLLELLKEHFDLVDFSYVNDEGDLHQSVQLNDQNISTNMNCSYGCGIFILKKK